MQGDQSSQVVAGFSGSGRRRAEARNPRRSAGFGAAGFLDGADALSLRTLLALAELELDTPSLIQGLEAGALGVMDENIGTATISRDEPEAFSPPYPMGGLVWSAAG